MKSILIKGKVFFNDIGVGTWGIKTARGKVWRPVNMPEQLKSEGAEVEVTAKKVVEDFSIHQWGEPIEIISFHTLPKY